MQVDKQGAGASQGQDNRQCLKQVMHFVFTHCGLRTRGVNLCHVFQFSIPEKVPNRVCCCRQTEGFRSRFKDDTKQQRENMIAEVSGVSTLTRMFRCRRVRSSHATLIFSNPCAQELRQNEIIDRLKAFSLIPDPGTVIEVSAGESRPLVIAYSADSLSYGGVHDLPVLASTRWSQNLHRSFRCFSRGNGHRRAHSNNVLDYSSCGRGVRGSQSSSPSRSFV